MLKDPTKFTVVRSKWNHGEEDNTSFIDEEGRKDCLGFLLSAAGLNDEQLQNLYEPIDVLDEHEWSTKLVICAGNGVYQSLICSQIIATNDNPDLAQEQREAKLTELFQSIQIELIFEDDEPHSTGTLSRSEQSDQIPAEGKTCLGAECS